MLFIGETALALSKAGSDARLLLFRALTFLLFLGGMASSRLIDYFVPFALLTSALAVSRALQLHTDRRATTLLLGVLLFIGIPASILNLKGGVRLAKATAASIQPERYRQLAEWLTDNSAVDDVVVTQWDDFPMLFFYDRRNRYPFGMSPMYGQGYDAQLFTAHQLLYDGRLRDPESLMPKLQSHLLLVSRLDAYSGRRMLYEELRKNPRFEQVFNAGELYLFRLK